MFCVVFDRAKGRLASLLAFDFRKAWLACFCNRFEAGLEVTSLLACFCNRFLGSLKQA